MLEQLNNLWQELKASNSKLDKQAALRKYDIPEVKEILRLLYDPLITFGKTIHTIDYSTKVEYPADMDLKKLLVGLADRIFTGKIADKYISSYIQDHIEYKDLLEHIINRDLKANLGVKTVLSVFPDLFSEYEVALATDIKKTKFSVDNLDESWILERKLDGVRCQVFITREDIICRSRTGQTFTSLGKLEEELMKVFHEKLSIGNTFIIDGELCVVKDGKEDFKEAVSQIRRKNYTMEHPKLIMFDLLTENEFAGTDAGRDYSLRLRILRNMMSSHESPYWEVIPSYTFSKETYEQLWKRVMDEGWEGLIARKDTTYRRSRSTDMLKLKVFEDAEFKVVDILPKKQMMLNLEGVMEEVECAGKLVIDYKGNPVEVGTGFSQDECIDMWANKEKYIGRTMTVQYQGESEDKDGKKSLRIPSFKGWRDNAY